MKTEHRTIQREDAYRANLQLHCCQAPVGPMLGDMLKSCGSEIL